MMNVQFYITLFAFVAIPVFFSKVLRLDKLLPLVFLQLVFGFSLHLTGFDVWLQGHGVDLAKGPLADSLSGMGWLGVSLLIALTGAEATPRDSKQDAWLFVPISVIGFVTTCCIGALVGYGLVEFYPELRGTKGSIWTFSFSIGLCLSVTALPVLIAILNETRLSETALGKLAVNCALLDDMWMWMGLATILSLSASNASHPMMMAALLVLYFAVMIYVVRPALQRWHDRSRDAGPVNTLLVSASVIFLSAAATDHIGVHSLLGAFVAGAVLPPQTLKHLRDSFMQFGQTLLLPVFFILTGMRLEADMSDPLFWQLTAIVTFFSVAGKSLSVAVAAHYQGLKWSHGFALGSLMQCKGLMELVAINILLDAGIIGPKIFSALAMMAMASTFMTAPVLRLWLRHRMHESEIGVTSLKASR